MKKIETPVIVLGILAAILSMALLLSIVKVGAMSQKNAPSKKMQNQATQPVIKQDVKASVELKNNGAETTVEIK